MPFFLRATRFDFVQVGVTEARRGAGGAESGEQSIPAAHLGQGTVVPTAQVAEERSAALPPAGAVVFWCCRYCRRRCCCFFVIRWFISQFVAIVCFVLLSLVTFGQLLFGME